MENDGSPRAEVALCDLVGGDGNRTELTRQALRYPQPAKDDQGQGDHHQAGKEQQVGAYYLRGEVVAVEVLAVDLPEAFAVLARHGLQGFQFLSDRFGQRVAQLRIPPDEAQPHAAADQQQGDDG